MTLCDAHCHLANLSQLMPVGALLKQAAELGIQHFLSSALTREEVQWHKARKTGDGILFSAGIHPSFDDCDLDLEDITGLGDEKAIWAVGEIGMDRGNQNYEAMKAAFIRQLELSADFQLPAVLHIVGYQQEACEIMRRFRLKYLIHGYAGSTEAYSKFSNLGAFFTISARIIKPDKKQLLMAMLQGGRYLFETDITRYYVHEGEANPLLRLIRLIEDVARISGMSIPELAQRQTANLYELAGI